MILGFLLLKPQIPKLYPDAPNVWITLPETNSQFAPENRRNNRTPTPTIHFQVLLLLVSGRLSTYIRWKMATLKAKWLGKYSLHSAHLGYRSKKNDVTLVGWRVYKRLQQTEGANLYPNLVGGWTTHSKDMCPIGNPKIGVEIHNHWNHQIETNNALKGSWKSLRHLSNLMHTW